MKKFFCKMITAISFLLLISSTAVFAADDAASNACDNVTTYLSPEEALAVQQYQAALEYREALANEMLAHKNAEYLSRMANIEHEMELRRGFYGLGSNIETVGGNAASTYNKNAFTGFSAPSVGIGAPDSGNTIKLVFHEKGWYVARLEVEIWDKQTKTYSWVYSDSCAIGQDATVSVDTDKYEISRVGYQIWFFGWDNDYMNLPWSNTDHATDFTLSGSGDYPEFSWK
ncbi:MAG: hypothetical protein K6E49_09080 [Lachnospiraceae bacterium]|nr:hypothetical protein [Lachnospiraceae bacterium]